MLLHFLKKKTLLKDISITFNIKSSSKMLSGSFKSSASSKAATISGSKSGRGPKMKNMETKLNQYNDQ